MELQNSIEFEPLNVLYDYLCQDPQYFFENVDRKKKAKATISYDETDSMEAEEAEGAAANGDELVESTTCTLQLRDLTEFIPLHLLGFMCLDAVDDERFAYLMRALVVFRSALELQPPPPWSERDPLRQPEWVSKFIDMCIYSSVQAMYRMCAREEGKRVAVAAADVAVRQTLVDAATQPALLPPATATATATATDNDNDNDKEKYNKEDVLRRSLMKIDVNDTCMRVVHNVCLSLTHFLQGELLAPRPKPRQDSPFIEALLSNPHLTQLIDIVFDFAYLCTKRLERLKRLSVTTTPTTPTTTMTNLLKYIEDVLELSLLLLSCDDVIYLLVEKVDYGKERASSSSSSSSSSSTPLRHHHHHPLATFFLLLQQQPPPEIYFQTLRCIHVCFSSEFMLEMAHAAPPLRVAVVGIAGHLSHTLISAATAANEHDSNEEFYLISSNRPHLIESLIVLELLADDSNFKADVVRLATPALLCILSASSSTVTRLFSNGRNNRHKLLYSLVLRIIGALHCFNATLQPKAQELMFINAVVSCYQRSLQPQGANHRLQWPYIIETLRRVPSFLECDESMALFISRYELQLCVSFVGELLERIERYK